MTLTNNVPVVDNWEDLLNSDNEDSFNNNSEFQTNSNNITSTSISNKCFNDYEERRRCQELVEEMDGNVMDDLFDGFVSQRKSTSKLPVNNSTHAISNLSNQQDAFSNLNLNSYGKVETTAFKIAECIKPALAKSPAWLRFIDICLNEIFQKLDLKDLKTLKKKVDLQLSIREKEEREKSQQKKKPNDFSTLSKNFREELDIFDGIDSLDESDDY
ncbi:Eukaryotic translation initiation factor 3 subunit J [Cryptosporidium tyzzeri]|nr:Eukaryotic translation initiation factor 3 subunit J [Cryptosporidium tyzzeri]